jgi:hypothetical protein
MRLRGDEMTAGWRNLRNEEIDNLYFSPSVIRMMKSRRMGLTWHVARIEEEKRGAYGIFVGRLQ